MIPEAGETSAHIPQSARGELDFSARGGYPGRRGVEIGARAVEIGLRQTLGCKQRLGTVEIEACLRDRGLRFGKPRASLVDALLIVGLVDARQHGSPRDEIAGLRRAHAPVRGPCAASASVM